MINHDYLLSKLQHVYDCNGIGQRVYKDLCGLIKEQRIVDWDGKEPLRRNHRVKWQDSDTPRVVVAVNDKHKQIVTITEDDSDGEFRFCGIDYIKPFKTEADKLFEEWYNTLGSNYKIVSFSEKQVIDLINLVLRKKDVLQTKTF